MSGLLTRKALVLAKIETTSGTDAVPTNTSDAVLVMEPSYSIDPKVLTRNFVRSDLSPLAGKIGRKLAQMKFKVECKGNGLQNSGSVANAPMLAKLLNACGFTLTGVTSGAVNQIGTVYLDDAVSPSLPVVTWAKAGTITLTRPVVYTLTVTTGGASGTAQVKVTSNSADDVPSATPVTITSGTTAVALGTKGGTLTPTFSGSLTTAQVWRVTVMPVGIVATPVSTGFKTATLYMYRDGNLHKMTAANGTFTFEAQAGEFGTFEFTFTGQYIVPTAAAMPVGTFEATTPDQVELANVAYDGSAALLINKWTYEQGNQITPRPSVNNSDGYYGTRITSREPKGGFDPEAETEDTNPFWTQFGAGNSAHFYGMVGQTSGNIVAMEMPLVQMNSLGYGDRDGILTYEIGFQPSRVNGDDEIRFIFC